MAWGGSGPFLFDGASIELGFVPLEGAVIPPSGFISAWAYNSNSIVGGKMKKNVAGQKIGAQLVSATDGSAFTGSVTVYITGDAGTQAAGSVGSGACTHEGNGFHTYAPAQAETNYDQIGFTFIGTGAVPSTVQLFTDFPQTGDSFARIGAPVGASISEDVAAVKAQTAAIEVDTANIQTRIPTALGANGNIMADVIDLAGTVMGGSAAGYMPSDIRRIIGSGQSTTDLKDFADTGYDPATSKVAGVVLVDTLTTYTGNTVQTGDSFARIGAPAGASVSADVAAVKAQTAAIETDTAEIGVAGAGLTNINLPDQTMDIVGNITGNLSGSVGSVTGLTPGNLDVAVSTRLASASYTAPPSAATNASAVRTELTTELGRIDAAITTRMATYTQPTGFLAATFPGTVASTTNITAGTITTTTNLTNLPTIPANWLTAAGTAADFTTEIQAGLATADNLATVDTVVDAIKVVTDKIDTALVLDGAVYQYTANALELAPTGGASITAADVWAYGTRILTAGTNIALVKGTGVTGFNDLSAAQVNAEVDTALADYDAPTNAEMVARTLAAASYATATALQTVDDNVDAILVDTAEIGVAGAGLTAIKNKTDNLPSDPASAGTLTTQLGVVNTNVSSVGSAVDTVAAGVAAVLEDTGTTIPAQVDAVKAKTDQMTFTVANRLDTNIRNVNGAVVEGNGTTGNEWGPA